MKTNDIINIIIETRKAELLKAQPDGWDEAVLQDRAFYSAFDVSSHEFDERKVRELIGDPGAYSRISAVEILRENNTPNRVFVCAEISTAGVDSVTHEYAEKMFSSKAEALDAV